MFECQHALAKTIGISILDFTIFPSPDVLHSRFRLFDASQQLELTDSLELHYLELPKLRVDVASATAFEAWLYALKFSDAYFEEGIALPKFIHEEEGIAMALDRCGKPMREPTYES